jgi:membrane protein involved in colicin uptake
MAAKKKQQTHAKRARELAVKERRERKRAKKAERAMAAEGVLTDGEGVLTDGEGVPTNGDEGAAPTEMPEDESAAGMAPVEAS